MPKQLSWSSLTQYIPAISFTWPTMLWLLLLVPLAVALYVLLLYRRKKIRGALRQYGPGAAGGRYAHDLAPPCAAGSVPGRCLDP